MGWWRCKWWLQLGASQTDWSLNLFNFIGQFADSIDVVVLSRKGIFQPDKIIRLPLDLVIFEKIMKGIEKITLNSNLEYIIEMSMSIMLEQLIVSISQC